MGAFKDWLSKDFKNRILAGILVAVPMGATILVLRWLFRLVEGFASPWVRRIFQVDFPGLGLVLTCLVLYLAGIFARNVVGKKLVRWFELSVVGKIPLVQWLYRTLKKIMEGVSLARTQSFKRVVLIEFPRPGVRSIGFVTGETIDRPSGGRWLHVFIPTVPNPTSGLLQLVREEDVEPTEMSIEKGIRLVVSGGFLSAEELSASCDF